MRALISRVALQPATLGRYRLQASLRAAAVLAIIASIAAYSARAQGSQPVQVRGQINQLFNGRAYPARFTPVVIAPLAGQGGQVHAVTDSSGGFAFSVPPGTYVLRVTNPATKAELRFSVHVTGQTIINPIMLPQAKAPPGNQRANRTV